MVEKGTLNDVLVNYLDKQGLSSDSIKEIKKGLHKDIKSKKVGEDDDNGKAEVTHGTSCPRIMTKSDLIVEM